MKNIILTSKLCNVFSNILANTTILQGKKTVGFISNAADVYNDKSFIEEDRDAFIENGFHIVNIDVRVSQGRELEMKLNVVDIIFISGGNTFYLLEKVRDSGLDVILGKLLGEGKPYIGSSAGSVILGNSLKHVKTLDDPSKSTLTDYTGLNFIDKKILPHYGNKKYVEKMAHILARFGEEELLTISDDEYFCKCI